MKEKEGKSLREREIASEKEGGIETEGGRRGDIEI